MTCRHVSVLPEGVACFEDALTSRVGREYQVGDKLPHDTGNCVECVCGQGAKVTCSPHQCAPGGDDINDYRPPGAPQPIPDAF
ncbi:hypothetical protein NQ315_001887 [Exocentrus adspersus]|uniref:VWFC domain-containing protein n=1 Tax=Exocentrus adspersus TaxID=1586481 RepID=A0AAV8W9Y3_9CUCU|nr:hypothetical protein NQ315_001887 [Exocentrus adspersus]